MSHYMFMAADFPLEERSWNGKFEIFRAHDSIAEQILTDKEYCYELMYYDAADLGKQIPEYIRASIVEAGEIEFWNVWLGGDEDEPDVEYWEVTAEKFTAEDFIELETCPCWKPRTIELNPAKFENTESVYERFTQYCMIIKG